MRKTNKITVLIILLAAFAFKMHSQIRQGKITYERKTNLFKKFKGDDVKNWLREEDKIKVDYFELLFNDSLSLFRPVDDGLKETMEWAVSKNTVYQDFNRKKRYTIKPFWGEELHLSDSLRTRLWKITENTRKIAGYNCRKAVWQANDSTRIYAWFSYDLIPSTGPESFNGLPGTILGLATEDGGVIYFAKKIELLPVENSTFLLPKKKKIYTLNELKAELGERYGKEKWFKRMMENQFGIW